MENGTSHSRQRKAETPTPPPPTKKMPPQMTDSLAAALQMAELGWSIIPLCDPMHLGLYGKEHLAQCSRPGKMPLVRWKQHQQTRLTPEEIHAHWRTHPRANVGVVTGMISGIVMVDIDTQEGEEAWLEMGGDEHPSSWEFGTGRGGRHLVYSWPYEFPPRGNPFKEWKGHLDFLGEGHQSVVPPSDHKSGNSYIWTKGGPLFGLPLTPAPPFLLERLQPSAREDRGPAGGEPGDRVVKRARAYAAAFTPAVSGSAGHATTFTLACALIHGLGLHPESALKVMLDEWNHKCEPPWSEKELRHKIESARDIGTHQKIEERPAPPSPPNPPKVVATAAEPPDDGFGVKASSLTTKPVEWFFDPFIPRGMLTALVGRPAVGKSTFQAFLAAKAKVTVICPGEEDVERSLLPRLNSHGVNADSVIIRKPNERWTFPSCKDRFIDAVRRSGADLVIFDPIDDYVDAGLDENNHHHVRDLLQSLRVLAESTGAAVIVCRHPGKDPNNVMVGSRAWRSVPRSVVELLIDEGPPVRRMIRSYKNSLGVIPPSVYFTLEVGATKGAVFTLGDTADRVAADVAGERLDSIDRAKIADAKEFLLKVLANGEMESKDVYRMGESERLNDRTLIRAASLIAVIKRREGKGKDHKSFWALPPEKPQENPQGGD